MTVTSLIVGATSAASVRVKAVTDAAAARLAVDTDPGFSAPVFSEDPVSPNAQGVADLSISGLTADTEYFCAVEEDAVLDTVTTGRFRTHPGPVGQAASFSFIATGDAGLTPDFPDTTGTVLAADRVSNAPTFDTMRGHGSGPLFFAHLGDLHYYDLGSGLHGIAGGGSLDNYRRAYDDVLAQTRQHQLYREVPLVYVWDDHDYGPNNSDGTLPTKGSAAQVYRERVPSYPLPDAGGAVYHSFQVGRVLFVVLDTRFYRVPGATMLGAAQKAWLEDLLTTSTAEALALVSSVRWINGPSDSWPGFATERQEIADLLDSTGWADRMVMLNADVHALAFDSGTNNPYGGFPVYVVGSVDATPFNPGASSYNIGTSSARDQYGVFTVADGGAQITITAQAVQNTTVLFTHAKVIDTERAEPEPPPPPTSSDDALPAGTVRPVVQWIGCDLVTGRIVAELPDLSGQISRILGEYTSASLSMPIPLAGPGALGDLAFQATVPGRSLIVAVVNDQPAWGGMVLTRKAGTDGTLQLATATCEAYLARRRVRGHTFTQVDEADIYAALLGDAGTVLGVGSGIGLEIDAPPTGVLRDDEYKASDRATVYKRLQERAGRLGGLEWTVELLWGDDTHTWVRKVVRVRPRIGVAAATPQAIFETTAASVFATRGASEASYEFDEDYSDGRGANYVVAYSSGEGDDQPASAPAVATDLLDAGFPIYERHWQPSSSIKNTAVLVDHAARELELRRNGANTWNISARWNVYPRWGIDWRIGDDVAWKLHGHRHPSGVTGQGRCIGYQLNPQAGLVSPVLLDPTSGGGQ